MCELNEVIAKSVELNNAIKKLNDETKVINSIVTEKRNAKKERINCLSATHRKMRSM